MMGGSSGNDNSLGDVWKSTDNGATWTRVTSGAEWSPRSFQNSVVMPDNSIVLLGGLTDNKGGNLNDVWRSADKGITWTLMNASAGWSPRYYQSSVALPDGSIVVMGGYEGGITRGAVYHNDVWKSKDYGATWVQINSNASWSPRWGQTTLAMSDQSIILMGGYDSSGNEKNDTWRSADHGATWIALNWSNGWPARTYHCSVAMPDGSIVLMGGDSRSTGTLNDVWRLVPD
jgi:hypothetical protein